MVPKAYADGVIVKPREDLDQAMFSSSIILPGNAQTTDRGYCMGEPDASAICEVVSVGRKVTTLKRGDIVLFDLHGISQVVFFDGQGYLRLPEDAVRARVHDVGNEAKERIEPLGEYVLTAEDRAAFKRHVLGDILVPDEVYREGYGLPDSVSRFVLERVVWAWPDEDYNESLIPGDLVFFSPFASCRFRRFGKVYRLVARDDLLGALE
jgi:hypothetical protein